LRLVRFAPSPLRPELQPLLIDEVVTAVTARGGLIDDEWLIKFDLRAVIDEIVETAMAVLSAALRERLPGIADEMDEAFSGGLRKLLASIAAPLPAL